MTREVLVARALRLVAASLLALAVVHFTTRPFGGGDIFWQLRTGRMILATGEIPSVDTFSYTVAGAPWNNHEWGYELAVALLHRAGGWVALRLMVLALFGSTLVAYARRVARASSPTMGLCAALLMTALASFKLVPAPQTASMALFCVAWGAFLGRDALSEGRRVAALFAFMVLWGNVTAESLTFLPFLMVAQVTHLAQAPAPRRRAVALALLLACVAPTLTPRASSTLEYALFGSAVNRAVNAEFAPLWAPAATVPSVVKALAVALVLAYAAFASTSLARAPSSWPTRRRVALGALACVGAILYERNLFLLAVPLAQMLTALHRATRERPWADASATLAAGAFFAAFCASIAWSPALAARSLASAAYWRAPLDAASLPVTCLASARALPAGARLFTSRTWASLMILEAPQARVFIDGRNREYPVALHEIASLIWRGAPLTLRALDVQGTTHVLAPVGWNALPAVREGPWRELSRGTNCAMYVRAR